MASDSTPYIHGMEQFGKIYPVKARSQRPDTRVSPLLKRYSTSSWFTILFVNMNICARSPTIHEDISGILYSRICSSNHLTAFSYSNPFVFSIIISLHYFFYLNLTIFVPSPSIFPRYMPQPAAEQSTLTSASCAPIFITVRNAPFSASSPNASLLWFT